MKKSVPIILWVILFFAPAAAFAVDITALDRVSVLMPRTQVVSILGAPEEVTRLGRLQVERYYVTGMGPMVSAGYIYDKDAMLAAHAFIFLGNVAMQTADRLKKNGFTLLDESGDAFRLTGKDDDSGRPVIVTISVANDLTTVVTFEQGFYERNVKQ